MATVVTTRPPGSSQGTRLADELRAVGVVWRRELIRFSRNRLRIITSLVQPVLLLFVLGTGLSPVVPGGAGFDFRTFMFPGIIAMTVLFTAIFSAVSIVWDREFGFLREMLVAPVSRGSIVVGKCLGGATVATLQGMTMLALAGMVHVPYAPLLLAELVVQMALAALVVTALGVLIASRITQMEAFQAVMQFLVMPMFFLSGAVFQPLDCRTGCRSSPRSTLSPTPSTRCAERSSPTSTCPPRLSRCWGPGCDGEAGCCPSPSS